MRYVGAALIALGLALSGYLLMRHVALAAGPAGEYSDLCRAVFGTGCDAALKGPLAVQLGIPLSGWGMVYYGSLACLLVLGRLVGEGFRAEAAVAGLVLSLLGALASGALLATFVLGWSAWCPLCVIVHAINFALPPVLKSAAGLSWAEIGRRLAAAAAYIRGDTPADASAARWNVVGLFCAGLVAVVLYQWVLIEAVSRSPGGQDDFDPQKLATRFDASPLCEIPLGPDEARLGKPGAAVKLVVFSDFQCPGCARFSGELLDLAWDYRTQLQIVFKHYPLGTACNPSLKLDLHPLACEAARAAEAARRQGRFWEFHNALFASRRGVSLDEIARKLRLDVARFDADRQAAGVSDRVRSDVELGIRLGLDATPAVFLNGRRVHDLETRALRFLIERELDRDRQSGGMTGSPPARVAQAW